MRAARMARRGWGGTGGGRQRSFGVTGGFGRQGGHRLRERAVFASRAPL